MNSAYRFLQRALWTCLIVALAVASTRGDERPSSVSSEKLAAIPKSMQAAIDKKQIACASALVAHKGKIVHRSTLGMQDIEGKAPLTDATIYRIASMSKPITSVAVMMLVEDGKLNVTDPLSKFVPEFKEMTVLVPSKDGAKYEIVTANREITIHDLLTHSSGITYRLINKPFVTKLYADAGVSDGIADTTGTIGDNVRKLARLPLVCQPGAAWEYGLNTDVLGYVIEVVSGQSLQEFIRERICKPLKMDDTWFVLPKDKRARLSALYLTGGDKGLTRVGDKIVELGTAMFSATYPMRDDNKYYSGGGGLVSTTGDYFRFCKMLLNRGELDGARVLKAETVDRMTKNQLGDVRIQFPGNDLMGYGFGILSEKGKEATHEPAGVGSYGWGGAFGTFFWIDPKNDLIGIFMMQVFPPDFSIAIEFKKLTYGALSAGEK